MKMMNDMSLLMLIIFLSVISGCKKDTEIKNKNQITRRVELLDGTSSIQTTNYANKQLHYYYAYPDNGNDGNKRDVLIYVPGLSGNGASFVPSAAKKFALAHNMIIIAPSFKFDSQNWNDEKSYQYPRIWSGDALLQILTKFRNESGIQTGKLYLTGFSAGAQFVERFALYKPDLCKAVVAHGSGGTVIPKSFVPTRFHISVGKRDTEGRIHRAELFYKHAVENGIEVLLKKYDCGHSIPPTFFDDSFSFFLKARS